MSRKDISKDIEGRIFLSFDALGAESKLKHPSLFDASDLHSCSARDLQKDLRPQIILGATIYTLSKSIKSRLKSSFLETKNLPDLDLLHLSRRAQRETT